MRTCPNCGYRRQEDDDYFVLPTECPNCHMVYNRSANSETPGERVEASKSSLQAEEGRPSQIKYKRCPFCAEHIRESARKCRHCGEWLDSAPKRSVNAIKNAIRKDIRDAKYGETQPPFSMPTAGKSLTGWAFIIAGGALGAVPAVFVLLGLSGTGGSALGLITVVAGAWLGKALHEALKKRFSKG